jgi:hypothetical protein
MQLEDSLLSLGNVRGASWLHSAIGHIQEQLYVEWELRFAAHCGRYSVVDEGCD